MINTFLYYLQSKEIENLLKNLFKYFIFEFYFFFKPMEKNYNKSNINL